MVATKTYLITTIPEEITTTSNPTQKTYTTQHRKRKGNRLVSYSLAHFLNKNAHSPVQRYYSPCGMNLGNHI